MVAQLDVPLVNNVSSGDMAARLAAQHNAPWRMYQPRGYDGRLAPNEFRTAMAIRCGILPKYVDVSKVSCLCNTAGARDHKNGLSVISHAINCGASGFTPANRHNAVKYAVSTVLRRYGLSTTVEPNFYVYGEDVRRRPDLVVWSAPPVTTDFVISQQQGDKPGTAAKGYEFGTNSFVS